MKIDHEKTGLWRPNTFDNHFPDAIQDFAVLLDNQLAKNGLTQVTWTDVPADQKREHEKAIWERIRDPKPAK